MRATTFLLSAALTLCASSSYAQTSYNKVVEPVTPSIDHIINAPIEYDERGVVKAQHFNADDLTDEQYQALLDEADRIKAYRAAHDYNFESEYVAADTTQQTTPMVEIELFDTTSSSQAVTSAPTASARIHTVGKGDTLYNISKRYDTSVEALRDENGLSGNALSIGQQLRVPGVIVESINTVMQPIFASAPMQDGYVTRRVVEPAPQAVTTRIAPATASSEAVYAVLPKDTLYAISRRTCVGVKDIIAHNGLTNPNALKPGQRITLPAGHCLTN